MPRLHLFEFIDQSWFPKLLRDYETDYLEFITDKFDVYKNIHPILEKGLKTANVPQIIDLGAGGGGGMVKIAERITEKGQTTKIILTDYYPNITAFKKVSAENLLLEYATESVDARQIPTHLKGLRTLFLAFHHFQPKDATLILKNAVDGGEPIAIFEIYERSFKDFISPIFAPIFVLLLTPMIKPFSFGRILFTYLIPIIPLLIMFDGLVSVLRSHMPKEVKEMIAVADPKNEFDWEISKIPAGQLQVHYILGTPKKEK